VRSVVACHTRPTERLAGPRPGGPVQLRSGPRAHAAARASSAWSPRVARSWDDAVACSPTARWWLAGGKVLPVSLWGPPGGRRATRAEAGLTEGGSRLRGGVAARCGGAWWGPCRREGWR
jgi:hypothetical protein